jgi:hypothetical protein
MLEPGCRAARRSPVRTRAAGTPGTDYPGRASLSSREAGNSCQWIFNADGVMSSLAGSRWLVDEGETS